MNDLVLSPSQKELDVFDKQLYPFSNANNSIDIYKAAQNNSLTKIRDHIFNSTVVKEVVSNSDVNQVAEKASVMTANISEQTQSMIDKGEWVLKASKKSGGLSPILQDKSGKFVKQLTLEPKDASVANNGLNASRAMSDLYLQQKMGEIMDQLDEINNTIQRVERGQLDDRIGLFLSAKQLFIEAMTIENETMRQLTIANSIKSATDARLKLMQSTISDIEHVVATKDKMKPKEQEGLINKIRESAFYINEAAQLSIAAYALLGEKKAQIATLQSYKVFIEKGFYKDFRGRKYYEILHTYGDANSQWRKLPDVTNNIESILLEQKNELKLLQNYEG